MSQSQQRVQLLIPLLFCWFMLFGCATGATMKSMVVPSPSFATLNVNQELKDNIHVFFVGGGEETNPLWTSEIGSEEFGSALQQSLKDAHYLGRSDGAQYHLTANILGVDQPMFGINFEVRTRVHYVLKSLKNEKDVFNRTIVASYTAGMSDSMFAVRRLRLANEGSARANILEFLKALSLLSVKDHEIADAT